MLEKKYPVIQKSVRFIIFLTETVKNDEKSSTWPRNKIGC